MKVIYIAGPFRAATTWEVECNVRKAETMALEVARLSAMPLCPHTNTRFFGDQPTEQFWLEGTLELLRRCDALLVLPDWENSEGSNKEIEEAKTLALPIFYGLATLEMWLKDPTSIESFSTKDVNTFIKQAIDTLPKDFEHSLISKTIIDYLVTTSMAIAFKQDFKMMPEEWWTNVVICYLEGTHFFCRDWLEEWIKPVALQNVTLDKAEHIVNIDNHDLIIKFPPYCVVVEESDTLALRNRKPGIVVGYSPQGLLKVASDPSYFLITKEYDPKLVRPNGCHHGLTSYYTCELLKTLFEDTTF